MNFRDRQREKYNPFPLINCPNEVFGHVCTAKQGRKLYQLFMLLKLLMCLSELGMDPMIYVKNFPWTVKAKKSPPALCLVSSLILDRSLNFSRLWFPRYTSG